MLDVGLKPAPGAETPHRSQNQPTSKIQHPTSVFSRWFRGLLGHSLHRVTFECPGRRKLSQLVTHHILGNIYRDELLTVMAGQRMPDEFRKNCRAPRPGLDDLLLVLHVHRLHLLFQVLVDERSFFYGTTHMSLFLTLLGFAAHDEPVGPLVVPGLVTAGWLAPGRHRITSSRRFAFAATMRMVDRVHGHSAVVGHLAQPALAPGFAQRH